MDKLHKPHEQRFVSELVHVREFFENAVRSYEKLAEPADSVCHEEVFGSTSSTTDADPNNPVMFVDRVVKHHLTGQLGCSDDVMNELDKICSPAVLKCGGELNAHTICSDDVHTDADLKTIHLISEDLAKRRDSLSYRQTTNANLKYQRWNFKMQDTYTDRSHMSTVQRVMYRPTDVVMSIVIMKPYNRPLTHHEIRLGRLMKADACYLVTGQNYLTDLRDMIQCQSDLALATDYSEKPMTVNPDNFSKEHYTSSFLFFDDTFYNDTRTERMHGDSMNEETGLTEAVYKTCEPIDLSANIRQFLEDPRRDAMGPFRTANMQDTQFIDLQLRLGQPYLYLHQGHCEHLLVVTDIRLMALDDVQDASMYPIQVYTKAKKRIPCFVCNVYTAKWIVYNNDRLPYDKAFFCDDCLFMFNYDQQGKKIGQFQAVPYFDRNALR